MKPENVMTAEQLSELVIDVLDDLKARDIKVLDVRGKSSITDIMVVASGTSDRQVRALASSVIEKARQHGVPPLGVDGQQAGEWIVVDLVDVMVHIMLPQTRDFYNLEKLWDANAPE